MVATQGDRTECDQKVGRDCFVGLAKKQIGGMDEASNSSFSAEALVDFVRLSEKPADEFAEAVGVLPKGKMRSTFGGRNSCEMAPLDGIGDPLLRLDGNHASQSVYHECWS